MKTCKANSAQEECGVWLDTAELKGKVKQKRLARPISKLLNPFAEGEGYNLAVALNFTQTKVEMPKTKQTSISMFFTPQAKALHKMCSSESPSQNPSQPSSSSASAAPTVKKRGRDLRLDDSGVDENGTEAEAAPSQNQGGHRLRLPNREFEDISSEEREAPQSKRRHTEPVPDDSQPPFQTWSQDPLFTCSQLPESEFDPTEETSGKKNLESSERSFRDSLQTDAEGRTSTQTADKKHPPIDDDKENSRSISFNTPAKHHSVSYLGHASDLKWTEPKSTPQLKHPGKEARFDSAWPKLSSSPLQSPQQRSRKLDEDSLSALFTQDSQGFRVIAHRALSSRSPLKDQSNLRSCAYKPEEGEEEEEEEDERLFTQDSQGNMVIKH